MNLIQMLTEAWRDTKNFISSPKIFWENESGALYALIGAALLDIAILLLVLGAIGVRLDWSSALGILGVGLLVLVVSFGVSVWRAIAGGRSYSLLSALIAGLLLLVPIFHAGRAAGLPPIHDISTDLKNPPRFFKVKEIRPPHANALDRKAWRDLKQRRSLEKKQRESYPKVKAQRFRNIHAGRVFEAAREAAHQQGWQIVAVDPKRKLIEATDSTLLIGFKDDIVIRVREGKRGKQKKRGKKRNHVVVDVRSVSRLGRSDLGANARRIEAFLVELKIAVKKARRARKAS